MALDPYYIFVDGAVRDKTVQSLKFGFPWAAEQAANNPTNHQRGVAIYFNKAYICVLTKQL